MIKMKSKEAEADKIDIVVSRYFKQAMGHPVEIFRIAGDKPQFYKVKIKKMKYEEC